MDTKNIVIICLVIIAIVMALSLGFVLGQQGNAHNNTNVTNATPINKTVNNTSSTEVQETNSYESSSGSQEQQQVDYNSPDSKYYRSDVDGSYHKMEEGGRYVYAQDAFTGEWSYWADKS